MRSTNLKYTWVDRLSPREYDVGKLVIQGMSNKRIAEALKISDHTAKYHVANFISKMDADTRVDAAVKFARWLDAQEAAKKNKAQETWFAEQQAKRYGD